LIDLDDLIASRLEKGEDEALLRQLKHFRNDLIRLLQNNSIEAYALEKGTVLDSLARKLIDIVDSDGSTIQRSARIVEVVRLGYRYQKDLSTPSTIVRKPAVRVR
jgi:molecular chaperone GrpE (heat shock protein)